MHELDPQTPLYLQIMHATQTDIANGTLKPGDKLPSVRDLALTYQVNPNTVQRAMSELERTGYVQSQRTAGRFITTDTALIDRLRQQLCHQEIRQFVQRMRQLTHNNADIVHWLQTYLESEDASHGTA